MKSSEHQSQIVKSDAAKGVTRNSSASPRASAEGNQNPPKHPSSKPDSVLDHEFRRSVLGLLSPRRACARDPVRAPSGAEGGGGGGKCKAPIAFAIDGACAWAAARARAPPPPCAGGVVTPSSDSSEGERSCTSAGSAPAAGAGGNGGSGLHASYARGWK